MNVSNLPYMMKPIVGGYRNVSVSGVTEVKDLIDDGCKFAMVAVEGGVSRVRFDGGSPSASDGIPLPDGTITIMSRAEILTAKFFASGSVKIHIEQMEI